jgi:chromosome segregation ATPase
VVGDVRLADATEHRIEREYNPAASNPFHDVAIPPTDLLSCHFLSQGEVVRMAESESEQIRFIDSFFDFRSHQRGIDEAREQLAGLDHEVARQIGARKATNDLQKQVAELRAEIAKKDAELKSPVFSKFQQAQAKTQSIDRAVSAAGDVAAAISQARTALEAVPGPPAPLSELADDPAVRRVRDLASRAKREALESLTGALDAAAMLHAEAKRERAGWDPAYAAISDEYSKEVQKTGGDAPVLSQTRARLVARLSEIENQLNAGEQTAALLRPTVDRRNELLKDLRDRQAAYTKARQDRCEWFECKSDGQIKARVSAASNRDDFRQRLSAMKRGS